MVRTGRPAAGTGARVLLGGLVLAGLTWHLGADPFVEGVRRVDAGAIALALAIGVPITVANAWRWRTVARALGVGVPMGTAVASCYRAQFLNCVLPGGVAGDVHRGVRHGRAPGELARSLRAVAWERSAGLAVFVALAVTAVLSLGPAAALRPLVVPGLLAVAVGAAAGWALRGLLTRRAGWWRAAERAVVDDLRAGWRAGAALPVVAGSVTAAGGHALTFVVAARTAGAGAPVGLLLPAGLVVLLAMVLPTSVAGWGPREGAAAWVFATAGLGAAAGVSTAVVYGVIAFAASAPGAVVLAADWWSAAASRVSTVPVRRLRQVSPGPDRPSDG